MSYMLPSASPCASSKLLHALVHQLDLLRGVVDPTFGSKRTRVFTEDFFVMMGNCRVAAYSPTTRDVGSNEDNALWWGVALLRDGKWAEEAEGFSDDRVHVDKLGCLIVLDWGCEFACSKCGIHFGSCFLEGSGVLHHVIEYRPQSDRSTVCAGHTGDEVSVIQRC